MLSRKFLALLIITGIILLNKKFDLNLSQSDMGLIVVAALGYIGVEGTNDLVGQLFEPMETVINVEPKMQNEDNIQGSSPE